MAEDTPSTPEEKTEVTPTPITPETPAAAPIAAPVAAQPNPVASPTNGLAIAAMVVGIVAVISGWIPLWGLLVSAAAIILGSLALKRAGGKGMAITGIVTGGVGAIWALFVTVFFVLAIIAGVTAADRAQQSAVERDRETQSLVDGKKDFSKGETAKFGNELEVKVNSVERNYNPGASYTAEDGKEYIVVNITMKNISEKSKYVMMSDFTVVDNGMTERYSFVPVTNELDTGSLAAGGSTTGNLAFEVTSGATDLKLQYSLSVFDSSYKSKDINYTLAF